VGKKNAGSRRSCNEGVKSQLLTLLLPDLFWYAKKGDKNFFDAVRALYLQGGARALVYSSIFLPGLLEEYFSTFVEKHLLRQNHAFLVK
jgi:hypothetical protein